MLGKRKEPENGDKEDPELEEEGKVKLKVEKDEDEEI